MVLLLADCKGSGRQNEIFKVNDAARAATHCDVNELPLCWTRSDTQCPSSIRDDLFPNFDQSMQNRGTLRISVGSRQFSRGSACNSRAL
jgi:hypothetical protein